MRESESGGLNLHVYPSPITFESRIGREVRSIRALRIFDRIEVAGVQAQGLPTLQPWHEGVVIRRLSANTDSSGFARKVGKTVGFSLALIKQYRDDDLACVNCHSVAALPACIVLKRLTGAKLVYDTHELETETQGLSRAKKAVYKIVERLAMRHIDHLVFVTSSIERWYRERYGCTATTTLYNYPDQSKVGEATRHRYFHGLYSLPETTKVFLYQGVVGEGRGVRELVQAFARPPRDDVFLVVLGYGPLFEQLKELAAGYPSVRFHQPVAPECLDDYTKAADVGVVLIGGSGRELSLSYRYSGPNKLFQYIQAGLPVLASNLVEFAAVLDEHPVGVRVDDVTPDEVAQGVERLMAAGPASFQTAVERAAKVLVWQRQQPLIETLYLEHLGLGTSTEAPSTPSVDGGAPA